jgi:hypothetical protein
VSERMGPSKQPHLKRSELKLLEISREGQLSEAHPIVCTTCWGVSRVTPRIDHCRRYFCFFHPGERVLGKLSADTSTLMCRIDGDHVDLSQYGCMELRHKADDCISLDRNPHLGIRSSANVFDSLAQRLEPKARSDRWITASSCWRPNRQFAFSISDK